MSTERARHVLGEVVGPESVGRLAELREREPVCPVELATGDVAWLVTRYEDVRQVLIDPRFQREQNVTGSLSADDVLSSQMSGEDGHASNLENAPPVELRRMIGRPFAGRNAELLRPRVQQIADDLVDAMLREGPPGDLVRQFALPLPLTVICEMLGVSADAEEQERLKQWSDAALSVNAAHDDVLAAWMGLFGFFKRALAEKRQLPGEDLLSDMVGVCGPEGDIDIIRLAVGVLIAGHETTVNAITLGFWRLLQESDQLAALRADPALVGAAVEELLRYQGPIGIDRRRTASDDVRLGQVLIRKGEHVVASIASANLDERCFARADRFDITRRPNPHLTFGHGPHRCLGAVLARVELEVALTTLLSRLPGLRLAVAPDQVRWKTGMLVVGLEGLPISW